MVNLKVTTFHIDFSTLDIEKGKTAISPLSINYVIQPTLQQPVLEIKGLVLEEKEQSQPEDRVST